MAVEHSEIAKNKPEVVVMGATTRGANTAKDHRKLLEQISDEICCFGVVFM